jgi:hypothetical protein
MSKSTVYRHLTHPKRWKLRHLKWVLHSQSSIKGGHILSPLTSHGFIGRSIGSNSGFSRTMRREQGQDEGSITMKTILTIVWNPNSFYLIDVMSKEEKYSARCYIDNIPSPICQRLIPAGKRNLVIHADNSQCPTAIVVLDFMSQKVRFASPPIFPRHSPI